MAGQDALDAVDKAMTLTESLMSAEQREPSSETGSPGGCFAAPASVAAQMHDHAMAVAGVPAGTYYRCPTFVETFADVAAWYGLDIVVPEADIYNFEIEGLGGKMITSEKAMPTVDSREPLIRQPGDLSKLGTPDFHRDGRLPYALEYMRLRRDRFRSTPLGGTFCAIFSLAVGLRGYLDLIRDMRRRPSFVRELFAFITDQVLIPPRCRRSTAE
jgi:hypothetical protein